METVADGIHRLGAELVNWFVIDDGGKLTLVDTGNPKQYQQLPDALDSLGMKLADVEAVVLTHAHGDHLGSSARVKAESEADVHVHDGDRALARGEAHREYERHYVRDMAKPYAWKALLFFMLGGATKAPPVSEVSTFGDGAVLDVPGSPTVLHTPGHTRGSSCLLLEDRGILFTGDSLVTLSIITGERGPMIMPGSFNIDSAQSLASLDRLRPVSANTVLPGHGEPWTGDLSDAIDQAQARGPH